MFLSEDVGHYLKPIINLLILSFLSLKSLWLTEKCHEIGWQAAKKPSVINFSPSQKVPRKLKREVFGYIWIDRWKDSPNFFRKVRLILLRAL